MSIAARARQPHAPSLELPVEWAAIGRGYAAGAAVDPEPAADVDLSGFPLRDEAQVNLLSSETGSADLYAEVRVDSTTAP